RRIVDGNQCLVNGYQESRVKIDTPSIAEPKQERGAKCALGVLQMFIGDLMSVAWDHRGYNLDP
ncbi:hypothetical protein SK128_005209, partial [Halocaridina rubra]